MSFTHLSAPNTTWICVYNHTQPPHEWVYSNWHAPIALSFTWIRVIFYVIDNGSRSPVDELAAYFEQPFVPGIYFIGADKHGLRKRNQTSAPKTAAEE